MFALTMVLLFVSMLQKQFNWPRFRALKGVVEDKPMPKLTFQNYVNGSFQKDAEAHLKLNFGFRPPLIRLYNQYLWDFYGKTPVTEGQVLFGKDGWMYEPWVVEDYYQVRYRYHANTADEMAAKLEQEAKRLYQLQHILEPYGTHLFVTMVPAKDLIYPEYLPENNYPKRENEKLFSPRFFNAEAYQRWGINHVNLEQWFVQMKDSVDFMLFPKTGTHWSNYASLFAADSLIHYMEGLGSMNLHNLIIGPRELDNARDPDDDLESLFNLIRPLSKPKYYYATVTTDSDTTATMPKIITIGDSFWWNIANQVPLEEIFTEHPYWYYNSTIYYGAPYNSVNEINLVAELLSADFINLFYSASQQFRMNDGFTKKALLALCYDPEEIQSVKDEVASAIKNTPEWYASVIEKANAEGKSIEEMIEKESNYIIDNDLEKYFPALRDSIPTKRSNAVEDNDFEDMETFIERKVEKTILEIKSDPKKMDDMRKKAEEKGKALEQTILDDAHWIVNYKIENGIITLPKKLKTASHGIQ